MSDEEGVPPSRGELPETGHKKEQLGRRGVFILLTNVIGAVSGYIALVLILRWTGAAAVGVLGFGLAYVGLLQILGDLGFGIAHTKRIAEGRDQAECLGTFLTIRILLSSLFVGMSLGGYVIWKFVLGQGFQTTEQETVMFLLTGWTATVLLADVIRSTFQARLEMVRAYLPVTAENLMRSVLLIAVAYFHLQRPGAPDEEAAVGMALAYVAGGLVYLLGYVALGRHFTFGRPSLKLARSYAVFAVPVAIGGAGGVIMGNTDRLMLQYFWSNVDVGLYFGVQKITLLLPQATYAFSIVLFPVMAAKLVAGDPVRLNKYSLTAERYFSLVIMPAVVFFIALPAQAIHVLLSDQLVPAAATLAILCAFTYTVVISGPYYMQFSALDRPKLGMWIVLGQAVVNFTLNLLLVPTSLFGYPLPGLAGTGAAIAILVTGIAGTLAARVLCRRLSGAFANWRLALHFVAGGVMFLVLWAVGGWLSAAKTPSYAWSVFELAGVGLLGLGTYLGILVMLREFTKKDLRLFLSILHPKRMAAYALEEAKGGREDDAGGSSAQKIPGSGGARDEASSGAETKSAKESDAAGSVREQGRQS